ncbi:MAG TPA: rhomboid family intramembrane serine protease, partial [Bacillota bacterium]|nr:rhomboid family intramembrane serine protease [Bacillota bacterium]
MLFKKIRYNSPVVLTFVTLSLMALGLNRLTNGESNRLVFSVYNSSWLDPLTYLRLFCHPLGHMNWAHLSSNMMLLLLTGPMLEEKYGSLRLFFIMLITAVITGLVQMFFFDT